MEEKVKQIMASERIKKIFYYTDLFKWSQTLRYASYSNLAKNWVKNRHLDYRIYTIKQAKKFKTSDTIFVLGSGPSLNDLTPKQKAHIKKHDSFGINYSYLFDLVSTFHSLEDGKKEFFRKFHEKLIAKHSARLQSTIWCFSERHLFRGIHPRLTPAFFGSRPRCCLYTYPLSINLEKDRPFCADDFKQSLVYRGSLTVTLDLVNRLEYKNIVLLGVDMDTSVHFFEGYDYMQSYNDNRTKKYTNLKYESMYPKGNKFRTLEEYLYAVSELYFKPRGITLYVGTDKSLLYPKLPSYEWERYMSV